MNIERPLRGRLFIGGILALYFGSIYLASFKMSYRYFWQHYLFVSPSTPSFLDTHNYTSAFDCARLGYDVFRTNPCDPFQVPLTYPKIWLVLMWLGVTEADSTWIGFVCAIGVLWCMLVIIGRVSLWRGAVVGAVVCSPAIMMAIETGNNDEVIFIIMTLALLAIQSESNYKKAAGVSLLALASALKYYPVVACISLLRENKRRALILISALLLAFSCYIWITLHDVLAIQRLVLTSTYRSYGGIVAFRAAQAWSSSVLKLPFAYVLVAYTICAIGLVAYAARKRYSPETWHVQPGFALDAFRIGAAIYCGTFLLMNSWDYRLIFLWFTLPQLFAWIDQGGAARRMSQTTILALVATLWLSAGAPPGDNYRRIRMFIWDEVINWYLFFFYASALFNTVPSWLSSDAAERSKAFRSAERGR